jgi:O-antigen ligase
MKFPSALMSLNAQWLALIIFVVIVFAFGGGARSDIQSLMIIRPLAVLALGFGLLTVRWVHIVPYRFIFMMAALIFVFTALQLVPLPPIIWHKLPSHQITFETDRLLGFGSVWRPISLTPSATWNALFALTVPASVLVLAVQVSDRQRDSFLPVIIAFAVLSGLFGVMQSGQPNESPLYFYRITNFGNSVGLFANRNHHATLLACLFPLLALFASQKQHQPSRARLYFILAVAVGALTIPLLLIAGSRAGLILAGVGLLSIWLCYANPNKSPLFGKGLVNKNRTFVLLGIGAFALVAVTVYMSRSLALTRFLSSDATTEFRYQIWAPIAKQTLALLPFGSGMGSFVEVFQMVEPVKLLSPAYVNHAHNDWLEVVMGGGLFGLALLVLATWAWAKQSYKLIKNDRISEWSVRRARTGAIIIMMFGLASVGDYPLRVPSLACIFVICSIWMASGASKRKQKSLV